MVTALRTLAGILAGLFVAFVLVVAVEVFSAVVHPFPGDFGGTAEEICRHVERYPAWVLAAVVGMWSAIAFVAVWVTQTLGNRIAFLIVSTLLLAGLAFNVSQLPYATWFKIAILLAVPIAIVAGGRWSRPKLPA